MGDEDILIRIYSLNDSVKEATALLLVYGTTASQIREELDPIIIRVNDMDKLIRSLADIKKEFRGKDEKIDKIINDNNSARNVLNKRINELNIRLRKVNLNVLDENERRKRLMREIRNLLTNLDNNMKKKIPPNLYLTYKFLGSRSEYYK